MMISLILLTVSGIQASLHGPWYFLELQERVTNSMVAFSSRFLMGPPVCLTLFSLFCVFSMIPTENSKEDESGQDCIRG